MCKCMDRKHVYMYLHIHIPGGEREKEKEREKEGCCRICVYVNDIAHCQYIRISLQDRQAPAGVNVLKPICCAKAM